MCSKCDEVCDECTDELECAACEWDKWEMPVEYCENARCEREREREREVARFTENAVEKYERRRALGIAIARRNGL